MIDALSVNSLSLLELSEGYSNLLMHRETIEKNLNSLSLKRSKKKQYLKDLEMVNTKIEDAKEGIEKILVMLEEIIQKERKNV